MTQTNRVELSNDSPKDTQQRRSEGVRYELRVRAAVVPHRSSTAGPRAPGHSGQAISVDNGTEFVSKAMDAWAYGHDVRLDFIRPGRPVDNAIIDSFNGRLRDECLNSHVFGSVAQAQALLDAWRDDYNRVRPHSSLQDRTPVDWAQYVTESREARDSVSINKLGVDIETTACSVTIPV